jgi:hypothetical protein
MPFFFVSCNWFVFHLVYYAEANQEKIVESGGLTSLLMLLRSFEDETIRRVAAGAIANLAMNGNCHSYLSLVIFTCIA